MISVIFALLADLLRAVFEGFNNLSNALTASRHGQPGIPVKRLLKSVAAQGTANGKQQEGRMHV
jgi:hypothetical protein